MYFKVVVAIRATEDAPWDFTVEPMAEFIDKERAIRFAKSEIKAGWGKDRVIVKVGRKVIWPISR